MSLTLTLLGVENGIGPFIEATVLIVPAGSYTAGGSVIDLTTLYGQTDPAGRTLDTSALPLQADVQGMASLAGGTAVNRYQLRTYTNSHDGVAPIALTPATCLLQVFNGITEASTTAYINSVLSDRIVAKLVYQAQA